MSKGNGKRKLQRNNIWKRGNSWYVRFEIGGREVRRSAGSSREAAQELLARLRQDAEREAVGLPKQVRNTPTLSDFAPRFLKWSEANKRSAERDKWCLPQLVKEFGSLRLATITKQRVEAFVRDRQSQVSAATVNRQIALIRRVLSYAVEQGELSENPLKGIKMLREPAARQPTLSEEEERSMIACSPAWFGLMMRLALSTGCRQGELLALTWADIDFDSSALIVRDSKSGESRRVPLHPEILAELKEKRGTPAGHVITLPWGRVPSAHGVGEAMRRAARKIGKTGFRFHDLRHIAGSRLLALGANLPEVATVLGHKTLSMARRYSHAQWPRLQDLIGGMRVTKVGTQHEEPCPSTSRNE